MSVIQTNERPEVRGDNSGDSHEVPAGEFFATIYRFFYSKVVGLSLILAMAVLSVIGSVVMQAPVGVYDEPESRADFLQAASQNYGGWTPFLDKLGFFHVFSSIPFYVVVGALALSIIACTTHRIPQLWARVKSPRTHVSRGFFDKARYRATISTTVDAQSTISNAQTILRKAHFRILPDKKDPERAFYADRYSWSGAGTILSHLGFVLILCAFVISSTWGIEEDIAVPVGREVKVGHDTGITLEATSFQDSYTEDGRPSDYVSHLIAKDGDTVVVEQDVRVNDPLSYGGFRYHQASFGTAVDMVVRDSSGGVIFDEAVPLKWRSANEVNTIGTFDLPNTGDEISVAVAASGQSGSSLPPGWAHIRLLSEDGTELDSTEILQGEDTSIGDYTVTFERERQYTGIRMRHDPGALLMWISSGLLIIGMGITFMFPYRRIWVRVDPESEETQLRFGAVAKYDASYQKLFESIVNQVEESLPAGASKENTGGE